jgi:UDP-GlcNAc:undecaprenyl-phosphate GlcNAc-1-phosphate transferase
MTAEIMAVTFAGGLAGALAGTWACRSFALRFGVVNQPNPIVAQHVQPIPYLGGVGLAFGVACAVVIGLAVGDRPRLLNVAQWRWDTIAGAAMFLLIGVADDVVVLSPLGKFLMQVTAAVAVITLAVLGNAATTSTWLTASLYLGGILILVNAVNLVDVCDGLVAGLASIVGLTFVALHGQWDVLPAALASATVGFLVWNKPPASIFLGDAGSHFIGFLLAGFSIDMLVQRPVLPGAMAVLLTNGVFLFELVFLVAVRRRKGIPWWLGSPDHFALRLQAAGFGRWGVDAASWSMAGVLGALALFAVESALAAIVCGVVALLGALWVWRYLLPIQVRAGPRSESKAHCA